MLTWNSDKLALFGGKPVREKQWPQWPRGDLNTEHLLLDVLRSGRWAISGLYNGQELYERRFAEAFAKYNGGGFCVPTANGSSALTIALEALGVGVGSEVLVPGLTWVACASSVARIGAIPVLVDVENDTLCMSVEAARKVISPRTAAIMVVHLYCTVADLDGFATLSEQTGIPLLEDCSQSHGAKWKGHRVGSIGKISAFSMQDTKVLSCGEGGAVFTKDSDLYDKLQQLRADGRRYSAAIPSVGELELEEVGAVQGHNRCLSEFHAAILLDRLRHLDDENRHREQNGEYLRLLLGQIGGTRPLHRDPRIDALTFYRFCVRLDLDDFGGADIETVRRALTAELNISVKLVDNPLNNNILYNPLLSNRTSQSDDHPKRLDPRQFNLPNATEGRRECLCLPHQVLLGNRSDMEDIARAFAKIKENRESLRRFEL